MEFPLYERLAQIKPDSSTPLDWNRLIAIINNLSIEHCKEIYYLIIHYCYKTKGSLDNIIPFQGKLMDGNRGVRYQISTLPLPLQYIISQYIREACS